MTTTQFAIYLPTGTGGTGEQWYYPATQLEHDSLKGTFDEQRIYCIDVTKGN